MTHNGNCGASFSNNTRAPIGFILKGCALGYYSFGHELGHMFGCAHNHEVSSRGFMPHGFGKLINQPNPSGYRTIMA